MRTWVAQQLAAAPPLLPDLLRGPPPPQMRGPQRAFAGAARSIGEASDAVAEERALIAAGRARFEVETQARAPLALLALVFL